jgi:hypothetical protein
MSQIEIPPYRGPRNPLDLVAIEIIAAGDPADDNDKS